MFDQSVRDATTLPTVLVKVGAEFQVGRTKTEFFHYSKATIESLARINGRTIGNSPVIVEILHGFPYSGRTELVRNLGNPDELAGQITNFAGGPNRGRITSKGLQALGEMVRRQGMIIVHSPDVGSFALYGGKVAVGVETPVGSDRIGATISHGHLTGPPCLLCHRIIGDEHFEGLNALVTKAGQTALEKVGTVAGYEGDTEENVRTRFQSGEPLDTTLQETGTAWSI